MLWDLNCRDSRFVGSGKPAFKRLTRLPLYYCWRCGGDIAYRVSASHEVQVFESPARQRSRPPYPRYPAAFARRPIELASLAEMPSTVEQLLDKHPTTRVPARAKVEVEGWLGRRVTFCFDIWWHQFGGQPWEAQGPEDIKCPNPDCRGRAKNMKILAAIYNDPPAGLPMIETIKDVERNEGRFNRFVQVVYHICENCLTLHAKNRCD